MSNNNNSNSPKYDVSHEKATEQKGTIPANTNRSNDTRSNPSNVQQHGSTPAQTTNSQGGEQKKPEMENKQSQAKPADDKCAPEHETK